MIACKLIFKEAIKSLHGEFPTIAIWLTLSSSLLLLSGYSIRGECGCSVSVSPLDDPEQQTSV